MKKHADISALFDGELSPGQERRALEHLNSCPECRALYEEFGLLRKTAASLAPFPVHPFFAGKIISQMSERRVTSVWDAIPILPRALSVAMIALSVFIIFYTGFSVENTTSDDSSLVVQDEITLNPDELWPELSPQSHDQALQIALLQ